jgi:hypothetical protein
MHKVGENKELASKYLKDSQKINHNKAVQLKSKQKI